MSCTLVSLPFLLLATVVAGVSESLDANAEMRQDRENLKKIIINNMAKTKSNELEKETVEKICKEYQTVFMDESVLVKTLEEYGLNKLEVRNGKITAYVDGFIAEFYKNNENEAYRMNLQCNENCNNEKFIYDINEEYAINVQEETYIKLKERLANKNMEIESEEVLEDNSIMITVNLE